MRRGTVSHFQSKERKLLRHGIQNFQYFDDSDFGIN